MRDRVNSEIIKSRQSEITFLSHCIIRGSAVVFLFCLVVLYSVWLRQLDIADRFSYLCFGTSCSLTLSLLSSIFFMRIPTLSWARSVFMGITVSSGVYSFGYIAYSIMAPTSFLPLLDLKAVGFCSILYGLTASLVHTALLHIKKHETELAAMIDDSFHDDKHTSLTEHLVCVSKEDSRRRLQLNKKQRYQQIYQ